MKSFQSSIETAAFKLQMDDAKCVNILSPIDVSSGNIDDVQKFLDTHKPMFIDKNTANEVYLGSGVCCGTHIFIPDGTVKMMSYEQLIYIIGHECCHALQTVSQRKVPDSIPKTAVGYDIVEPFCDLFGVMISRMNTFGEYVDVVKKMIKKITTDEWAIKYNLDYRWTSRFKFVHDMLVDGKTDHVNYSDGLLSDLQVAIEYLREEEAKKNS